MIAARWRWRIGALLVLAVAVVLVLRGSNRPEDPDLAPPSTTTRQEQPSSDGEVGSARSPLEGFDEVAFRVAPEGAEASTWCALLADRVEERSRGLTGQEDLLGYDAMAFRYEEPTTITFTMRDTQLPLSIAFFDEDGAFVSARDMDPCPPGTSDCPSYAAEAPYLHALEVEQGELPSLGIRPGARLSFPDQPCPAA